MTITVDKPRPLESRLNLSPREFEILDLMASGASNGIIAERLKIAERTVENRTYGIFSGLLIADDPDLSQRVKAVLIRRGQLTAELGEAGLLPEEGSAFEFFKEKLGGIKPLTPGEYEVLSLVAQGYSNACIAGKLFMVKKSIENCINEIYRKLNIHSYKGTIPRVMAMLMFDGVPEQNGYKSQDTKLVRLGR